jgi:hypothetical protein
VENREAREEISRRSFLKPCVVGISTTALLFASGCLGGGDDDDDDDYDGGRRRR